jgi:hypothetical protein
MNTHGRQQNLTGSLNPQFSESNKIKLKVAAFQNPIKQKAGNTNMKLQLSQLQPNPFKKEINNGKLNETQIDAIRANLKELGLMGSLPVFQKDGQYFLISGHHRVEALKREFGKQYQIEVTIHDYSEDNILRGMIVENLSQRGNDFREELENVVLIQKHLETACSPNEQARKDVKGINDNGSVRDIANWLNKHGTVMAIGRISQLISMHSNLAPEVLEKVKKASPGGDIEPGTIPQKDAIALTHIQPEEQEKLANIVLNSGITDGIERTKLINTYRDLPEDERKEVLEGTKDITTLKKGVQEPKSPGEMNLVFQKKATDLIVEMRNLRQTLNTFRTQKLWHNFTPHQRSSLRDRLTNVHKEYTNLIHELDETFKVIENE